MCEIDVNGKAVTVINVHYALENYEGQVDATMKFLEAAEGPVVGPGEYYPTGPHH